MPDNTLVVVALVGLGVICLGMFAVMFVILLRFTGRNFLSFFSFLMRSSQDDDDDQPSYIKSPKPDLRSLAQAEDFDSALARQAVRDANTPSARASFVPPTDPAASGFDPASPRLGSRRTEPYQPVDHDSNDPIFGDLLDLDGDLDI